MNVLLRKAAAVAALTALCTPAAALSAGMSGKMTPGVTNTPSRFSGPGVYTGDPALPVTLSVVLAGGGPSNFKTVTLLKVLTGDKFDAEVGKLTTQYGKAKIGNFINVFDFVIADTLKIVTEKKIALPAKPSPDADDGKELAAALWGAGQTGAGFNVEVMLDRAVSHGIHDQVMKDIDAKFGLAADADYHAVLNTAMHDLASVYKLKS